MKEKRHMTLVQTIEIIERYTDPRMERMRAWQSVLPHLPNLTWSSFK